MRLKVMLLALCAIVWCVGCNDDDVDTSYSLRVDKLVVTLEDPIAEDEDVSGKFYEFLVENEYLADFQFSGESRKENNDKAVARFEEKYKSLQMIDLGKIFSLTQGQTIDITFVYSLFRGEEQIGDSKQVSLSDSVPET